MLQTRTYFLYKLCNPNSDDPKYVGITNNPAHRLRKHLLDSSITKKTKWIASLAQGGLTPELKIIKETTNVHEVINWEIEYISKWKDIYQLTNSTLGGEYKGIGTPIQEFDLEGNYIESYSSMIEYTELHNLHPNIVASISAVCSRKRNYAYDKIFRYMDDTVTKEDVEYIKSIFHNRDPKHFFIFSLDGKQLGEFNSFQEAERMGFGNYAGISQTLAKKPGYYSVKGNLICKTPEEYPERVTMYIRGTSKGSHDQPISKYDLEGNYLESYYTFTQAAASVNSTAIGLIRKCCEGEYKQALGYQWQYGTIDKIDPYNGIIRVPANTPVIQMDLNYNEIKVWDNVAKAAESINRSKSAITSAIKKGSTSGGFKWKYVKN